MENNFFKKDDSKRGILIEEYNGKYSLTPATKKEDGSGYYFDWVQGEHYDKELNKKVPDPKKRPLKVFVGTKEDLSNLAKFILMEEYNFDAKDDMPF